MFVLPAESVAKTVFVQMITAPKRKCACEHCVRFVRQTIVPRSSLASGRYAQAYVQTIAVRQNPVFRAVFSACFRRCAGLHHPTQASDNNKHPPECVKIRLFCISLRHFLTEGAAARQEPDVCRLMIVHIKCLSSMV